MTWYIKEIRQHFIVSAHSQGYDVLDISLLFNIEESEVEQTIKNRNLSQCTQDAMNENQVVYFIQQENTEGLIKIGFTSKSVEKRLKSLKTATPYNLKVLKTIDGGEDKEKQMHERFKKHRVNPKSEWFYPSRELLTFIATP